MHTRFVRTRIILYTNFEPNTMLLSSKTFVRTKKAFKGEALPGVLGIQGEGLFIFRDLGRRTICFQGFGEFLEF